jgi:peptide/nickel transport system substrate-binding protein
MHTRWPLFIALVVGVSLVALLWFVVLSSPGGATAPASGGHYVEGVTHAPERMNPLFASGNPTDADVTSLVFSGLVRLDSSGIPQPDLAERWEITGNGQSYVFHLRHGVAWHDGESFSADDVVFTFKAIMDPAFKGDARLAQLMQGVVVTARDAFTVEFKLEQAYAPFLAYMTVGILPEHLLSGLDANQLFNAEFNSHPIGTGPYRFRRHTANGVELETNDTYYLGPPHISTFEFRTYTDVSALAARMTWMAACSARRHQPRNLESSLRPGDSRCMN